MRSFKSLLENDEHLAMLHEILTGHGYEPVGTRMQDGTMNHYQVSKSYDHSDNDLHEGVHDTLKQLGWTLAKHQIKLHDLVPGHIVRHTYTQRGRELAVTHCHYPPGDEFGVEGEKMHVALITKGINEDEHHDYFASMPPDHLHAETHRILQDMGFASQHADHRGHHYHRADLNAGDWGKMERGFDELGWQAGSGINRDIYTHPNGSRLQISPWNASHYTHKQWYGISEAVSDNEYWGSMPTKHLHHETHNYLLKQGFHPQEDNEYDMPGIKKRYYRPNHFSDADMSGLKEHGWKELTAGTNQYERIHVHPNGATLIHKGADVSIYGNWSSNR